MNNELVGLIALLVMLDSFRALRGLEKKVLKSIEFKSLRKLFS